MQGSQSKDSNVTLVPQAIKLHKQDRRFMRGGEETDILVFVAGVYKIDHPVRSPCSISITHP